MSPLNRWTDFLKQISRTDFRKYWFDSLHYAQWKIEDYCQTYNSKRKHRSLKKKTPDQIWNDYFEQNKNRILNSSLLNPFRKSVQSMRG
ncbi:MAG: integrase core domain-containing protein [Chlorobi bacterium]|nr:integrase core domain-containing protein [Chlorobiota bacterium]